MWDQVLYLLWKIHGGNTNVLKVFHPEVFVQQKQVKVSQTQQ